MIKLGDNLEVVDLHQYKESDILVGLDLCSKLAETLSVVLDVFGFGTSSGQAADLVINLGLKVNSNLPQFLSI